MVKDLVEQPLRIDYAWREEPLSIRLLDEQPPRGVKRAERTSYIVPDFLVEMLTGKKRLVEIKPSAKTTEQVVARKLAVGRLFADRQGWSFHVVTERELFRGPILQNVRLLARFRHLVADPRIVAAIQKRINLSAATVAHLASELAGSRSDEAVTATVFHLVASGSLDVDLLSAPLTLQSNIHPRGTFPWDPFDSVWAPSGSLMGGPSGSSVS
jgi:hypothetical protein